MKRGRAGSCELARHFPDCEVLYDLPIDAYTIRNMRTGVRYRITAEAVRSAVSLHTLTQHVRYEMGLSAGPAYRSQLSRPPIGRPFTVSAWDDLIKQPVKTTTNEKENTTMDNRTTADCPVCNPEVQEPEITEQVFRVQQIGEEGYQSTFIVQRFTKAEALSSVLEVLLAEDEFADVRNISVDALPNATILT